MYQSLPTGFLTLMSMTFLLVVGIFIAFVLALFLIDVCQRKDAIRHNYPVLGRLRPMFEHLGIFFRQYFFAIDRGELPFNREQRNWVYRAAAGVGSTIPFGSTRDLRQPGTVLFVNCPFPTLESDSRENRALIVGPDCRHPYAAASFFNISAMSFGAISKPAVLALSNGARIAGCWLNTGEGGLSPWHLEGGADLVFQIGTAKYGVRTSEGKLDVDKLSAIAAHEHVRMFEIKLSQGAKPGKGGILPGCKVTPEIAAIRGIPAGADSISPNRFPEIGDPGELLDFIRRVREATGKPTGFKCVVGAVGWLDDLFAEIDRRGPGAAPDFITIDSADGGSGAAPMSLMDNVGLTLAESLPAVIDGLVVHGLRERVKVIASGKMITSSDVAWALCMGADFVTSARGFMFALGCIQSLRCHRDTCPTGITTHRPRLQRGLDPADKATRVHAYVEHVRSDVGVIAHSCGVPTAHGLRRKHARIVSSAGPSIPLEELYPDPLRRVPSHGSMRVPAE